MFQINLLHQQNTMLQQTAKPGSQMADIAAAPANPQAPASRPPRHLNELKQQRYDRIDQRRRKNPLRRLIPMRIDIDRKKRNIQHQARHRNSRDLRPVVPNKRQKILDRKSRIELHKIVNDKA
jgi:hypothetical protein